MIGPIHVLNYTYMKCNRTVVKYETPYVDTADLTHIYTEMLALEQNKRECTTIDGLFIQLYLRHTTLENNMK
jgi:hypothetical protein